MVDIITGADLAEAKVGGLPCGWLIHQQRRHADEGAGASGARAGQGAPRRRPGRAGRRRDARCRRRTRPSCVDVDYEELPRGDRPAAPRDSIGARGHDEARRQHLLRLGPRSDKAAVDAAFASAAHVTKLAFVNNRLIPNAIEPRAANASYNRSDESYTLYVANQNPHVERLLMMRVRARPAGARRCA